MASMASVFVFWNTKLSHINCVKLAFDNVEDESPSQMGQMVQPGSLFLLRGEEWIWQNIKWR